MRQYEPWWNRFGPVFAADIRKKRSALMRSHIQWRWHLDEVFVRINGKVYYPSVANSYSRGDREFEKATAMLFPSEIAQRGRMRDHTAAPFRRRVTV